MTNATDKAAMAAKIKALMSKSTANGATEEEAMSAMAMAMKLMDKYQIELSELETRAEGFAETSLVVGQYFKIIIADRLAYYIGKVSNTKPVTRKFRNFADTRLEFFGFKGDVDFANWLYNHLETFCLNASKEFARAELKKGTSVKTHHNRRAFLFGATARIAQRMERELAEREKVHAQASSSRGLVIVNRLALVEPEFAKKYPRLKAGRAPSNAVAGVTGNAYAAGQAAGDRARWDRPVDGGSASAGLLK